TDGAGSGGADKLNRMIMKNGDVVIVESYEWGTLAGIELAALVRELEDAARSCMIDHPGGTVRFCFNSAEGAVPQSVRSALEAIAAKVETWPWHDRRLMAGGRRDDRAQLRAGRPWRRGDRRVVRRSGYRPHALRLMRRGLSGRRVPADRGGHRGPGQCRHP